MVAASADRRTESTRPHATLEGVPEPRDAASATVPLVSLVGGDVLVGAWPVVASAIAILAVNVLALWRFGREEL